MNLLLVVSITAALAIAAEGCSSTEPGPSATGGASSGGVSTGGASSGGVSTGGASSGGVSTGGASTGGAMSGGASSGGASSGGASTGGAMSGGASTGGASAGSANGGTSGAVAVSYASNVQPILMAKCGMCHGGQSQGHHNIATTYADAKRPAESLQFDECWTGRDPETGALTGPKTIGECSMILGRAGKMPASEACDAPTPPDPSKCLTTAEKDTLVAWVAGGMAP